MIMRWKNLMRLQEQDGLICCVLLSATSLSSLLMPSSLPMFCTMAFLWVFTNYQGALLQMVCLLAVLILQLACFLAF